MSGKKSKILIALLYVMLALSCKPTSIPYSYRYSPREMKRAITGSWIEVSTSRSVQGDTSPVIQGELISVASDTLIVLNEKELRVIDVKDIISAKLLVYYSQAGKVTGITVTGYIPVILGAIITGEVAFLEIGIPWLISGTVLALSESKDKNKYLIYPESNTISDLARFARFPEGIPRGLDRKRLSLMPYKMNYGRLSENAEF